MVIYEVNIDVEVVLTERFEPWLEEHIHEMLEFAGFVSAETFQVAEPKLEGKVRWSIRYSVEGRRALNDYFLNHAAEMRQKAVTQFGDRVSTERRILRSERRFGGG